jgi:formylmethanofuran dehydrogenase subunit E
VSAVTGVRLGRRSLKFLDYGKVAATFYNTETGEAVRVLALDEARRLADERFPQLESKKERQMRAYREAADEELFKLSRVSVDFNEMDAPGHTRSRLSCDNCSEGINDGREVRSEEGQILCRPCAFGAYYRIV